MNNTQVASNGLLETIGTLFNSNLPQPEFNNRVDDLIVSVKDNRSLLETNMVDILDYQDEAGNKLLEHTLQGHALRKPFGYSGDFLIIDRIYTKQVSRINKFRKWDKYMLQVDACKAVRNRKDYFKTLISNIESKGKDFSVLDIASGPARDIFEAIKEGAKNAQFHCVDMDRHAINYAKNLTQEFKGQISFTNKNIFRFHTEEKHDLVWSAGLFDYFNDKAFVLLLKKFRKWVKPGGEIVIGNFNEDHNPSRDFMELFGDWKLIHRTKKQLILLAIEAGYDESQIRVGQEAECVNLFLHIKN